MTARTAWKAAHRRQRIERRTDAELYRLACECAGVDPAAETFSRPMMYAQRIFTALERLSPPPESDRYARTRTVLNSFGRGNGWRAPPMDSPRFRAWQRHSCTVHRLRQRMLARRLIAPEPGGYVTGLLSEAPPKMWWHDCGSPVAPLSRDDVALYESAPAC